MVATAPQIGNTGWNHEDAESRGDKIWVAGYAVRDPSPRASNWRATGTLDDELVRQGIVGIAGIDTRAVVRHLRTVGFDEGRRVLRRRARPTSTNCSDRVRSQPSMLGADLAGEVSTDATYVVEPDGAQRFTVAALDLGIKTNTPRNFASRGIRTHVLPSSATFDQIAELKPDGVFLSNGPGDPATADHVVAVTREVLGAGIPLFGICFGNQILGRALGRSTYKMVFGHRGINMPVMDHATGRVAITAQNHGFALEGEAGEEFDTPFGRAVVSHTCANDGVVEGIKLVDGRAFSVQYHPEAAAGPHDAEYLFDQFVDLCPRQGRGGQPLDATSHRPQPRPGHRLGADRHRAGLRVRLLGHPGLPGAARRGPAGQPDQLEPGDDHDRPGVRRQHLRRADHPGVRREGPRPTGRARQQDRRACSPRSVGRPRSTPPSRCTRAACWRSTASS